VTPVQGPIVPRKRLAAELRRLREAAGKTLDQVAHELMVSTSKLSRLENAQGSPQPRDVRDLARYYGVDGTPVGNQLMSWATAGRQQGWWARYGEVMERDPGFDAYLAYENEAAVANVYTIPYVTGLLQIPEYTAEMIKAKEPWRTAEEVNRFVAVRSVRQEGLYRRDGGVPPLELRTVLHECCLTQLVGDAKVMRAQLEALLKVTSPTRSRPGEFPKLDLRVLPASAAPHRMNTCTWSYFVFEGAARDRDVVAVETHAGFLHLEKSDEVQKYAQAFEELMRRSLDPTDSRRLIEASLERWADE
jgi:transcriptional regulator with XRE-family HTH domain